MGLDQPAASDPRDRLAALLAAGSDDLGVPGDAALVLAVSGGADSMAMLHGAARLVASGVRRWHLVVAHLDHGLRDASGADARFVADAAGALGLDVRSERVDVGEEARRGGEGIEATGRRVRYAFLERVADAVGPRALICTAHTADDQAETVLLNFARGTGLPGLRGIAPRRGRLIRPLLRARRADLRAALDDAGVSYLDDASNQDPAFARNRARGALVPLLESLHPGATAATARLAELAAEEDAYLAELAAGELEERRAADGSIAWDPPPHPVLARRILRLAAGPPPPSAERIEALARAAAEGRGGRRIELGQGRVAEVTARHVVIHRAPAAL
jgi:tRNA(Ile)-lysidine synthase